MSRAFCSVTHSGRTYSVASHDSENPGATKTVVSTVQVCYKNEWEQILSRLFNGNMHVLQFWRALSVKSSTKAQNDCGWIIIWSHCRPICPPLEVVMAHASSDFRPVGSFAFPSDFINNLSRTRNCAYTKTEHVSESLCIHLQSPWRWR